MVPTLGTIIPVIGAGGFAAAASVAGSVAGSVAIAASFGGKVLSYFRFLIHFLSCPVFFLDFVEMILCLMQFLISK